MSAQETTAKQILVDALNNRYSANITVDDDALFYAVKKADDYKNVYFLQLDRDHDAFGYCSLTKNKSKKHKSTRNGRSYCVNVESGKVVAMCFSSKCKTRNGGKAVLCEAQVETSEEDCSSTSDEDDDEDEVEPKTKRVKHA